MSAQLAEAVGRLLDRPRSRRNVLVRLVLAACAFAVAPLRYLLRPGTAWAVVAPGNCSGGALCNDGYTAFCCEVHQGVNTCPKDTYIAGWWKCTDYRGAALCAREGVRYYVDCNRIPGHRFRSGCQCADNDCNKRRIDCNAFRYGQCNTQVAGTTEVACRLVVCQHPATIPGFHCNDTYKVDNTTCSHEAPCLTAGAVELPGGGGA